MKKIIIMLAFASIIMAISAFAYDIGLLKFSDLFSACDVVVSIKVDDVEDLADSYTMTLQIDEVMYGNISEDIVTVSTTKYNGYYSSDLSYLENGKEYILFLKNVDSKWVFTGYSGANFDVSLKDDIKQIIRSYESNRDIFSENNSNALIGLYCRGPRYSPVRGQKYSPPILMN